MAKQTSRLNARSVQAITKPGYHADGDGLYLVVDKSGAKRWAFIFQWQQKRTEMGLGNLASVSLKDARERAGEARSIRSSGRNPVEVRKEEATARQAAAMTFGEYAETFTASVTKSLKNDKHRQQWRMTLSVERDDEGNLKDSGYCLSLRPMRLADITTEDVLGVLAPIWETIPETAARLQNRIERVLDGAKVKGYRTGDNPARWRGHLNALLKKRSIRKVRNHPAMPYREVPAFLTKLHGSSGMGANRIRLQGVLEARKMPEQTSDKRLWVGAVVFLGESDDETDPIRDLGKHIILGIDGADIKVNGSPRWYPASRVQDVLPDFTMGIDDKRNEPDDAGVLRLLVRMRSHQKRADELEPEKNRTHTLWREKAAAIGVGHPRNWKSLSKEELDRRQNESERIAESVGYREAARVWQGERTQAYLLQAAIRAMPVHTLAGLKAKAEATQHWHYDGCVVPNQQDEDADPHDLSLVMMLSDIGGIAEAPKSRYRGPEMPDLSQFSWLQVWKLYRALSAMRDLLEPLEDMSDAPSAFTRYVEAWADVLFGTYADIGEYAVKSRRTDLHLIRAQYTLDFAEGAVEVVGKGVPSYIRDLIQKSA